MELYFCCFIAVPVCYTENCFNDTGRLCVAYMSDALRIMQIIEAEDYAFDVSMQ